MTKWCVRVALNYVLQTLDVTSDENFNNVKFLRILKAKSSGDFGIIFLDAITRRMKAVIKFQMCNFQKQEILKINLFQKTY